MQEIFTTIVVNIAKKLIWRITRVLRSFCGQNQFLVGSLTENAFGQIKLLLALYYWDTPSVQMQIHLPQRFKFSLRLFRARHREDRSRKRESIPEALRTQSAGLMRCSRALLGLRVSETFLLSSRRFWRIISKPARLRPISTALSALCDWDALWS